MTYQELRRQVQADGLLDRRGWYTLPIALMTVALGLASVIVLVETSGVWRWASVPLLSLFWIQVGFMGHDAGHNQVFSHFEHNRRFGLFLFPFLLGMTFRTWVIKHNLHHAETNIVDSDPDLQNPIIALTEEAARERRGVLRWVVRYQAYAYPLLALFATIAFRVDAWRYALHLSARPQNNDKYDGERWIELVLLGVNAVLWLGVPSVVFGPATWLPIFLVAQMLLGVHMAFVFAPNHKGMPMFTDSTRLSFMEQQVLTSRNVAGSPIVDFMYGGLNYQIEHHLFPTMPRRNLRKCREFVRRFCAEINLTYTEESVLQSFQSLFSSLDEIGRTVLDESSSTAVVSTPTPVID